MSKVVKIYDKSNRILACIDNDLKLATTYKYKHKTVIISRNFLNHKESQYNSWINHSEKDTYKLVDSFLMGNKIKSWSISKKYERTQKFDEKGREVYYKRVNIASGAILEKKFHYLSDSSEPVEIENYNGIKTLISIASKDMIDRWKVKKK